MMNRTESFNKVCRACLCEYDENEMKNLFSNKGMEEHFLVMFIAVSDIELVHLDRLCSFICVECEKLLNISYRFRLQCQQSHKILLDQMDLDQIVKDDEEVVKQNGFDSGDKNDSGDSDYNPLDTVRKKAKARNVKQTMRLTQFSYDKVTRAIAESQRKFIENTECIRCGFVGSNGRALSVHVSYLHKDLKDRWCAQCNEEFADLKEHFVNHRHDDLKCQFCEKILQSKGHLTEHLRSHSDVRPYICNTCEKCFVSHRHLKVHLRTHSNERPYQCHLCERGFIQNASLKNHLKRHEENDNKNFVCSACQENFNSKGAYKEHNCPNKKLKCIQPDDGTENIFSTARNFCIKCNKKVRSLDWHNKQLHYDGSKALNDYGDNILDGKLCTVCGKQFRSTSKLRVHMRVHTGEAPYKCSYCIKRVSTRNQLVVHERTHTGERPHVCHVCGKGFAQSSVLNTHMRLHTGRPEVCKICDQRFCRPAELRLHMRKHTGEKPFLCTECGQAFIQRSHLVEHNKTHSDLRPYQCMHCNKAFKQSSSLKSHVQIHLGRKPFQCSQCSYACRQSYSLTQHMKQHASDAPRPDRPHVCSVCNKSFTTVAMLSSHASAVHRIISSI